MAVQFYLTLWSKDFFSCSDRMGSVPKSLTFHNNTPPAGGQIDLLVHGQGVFLFNNDNTTNLCTFVFHDLKKENGILVEFANEAVNVNRLPEGAWLDDPKNFKGLTKKKGAFYWFSLDCQNQVLMAGIGEARIETAIYFYEFPRGDQAAWEANKAFLESLTTLYIAKESMNLIPISLLRDPITYYMPLLVKDTNHLTMEDIAKNTYMPKSTMTLTAQKLYDCISGRNFLLDDKDFPDFTKAIERSIATPGLWCYEKIRDKSREFNPNVPNLLETYLRITLSQNNGESPGVPYVMEIWPIGHYSPIHNHAGADAIIRILNGTIEVSLFPYLCEEKDGVNAFSSCKFKKGDITWISPTLNQTHQLMNVPKNKETCITIQCYTYDDGNNYHYDYFDYVDVKGNKQQYEPDSDMDFVEFKALMKKEWAEFKAQRCCMGWLS